MKKEEFLRALEKKLSGLPKKDIDERLSFYGEMIDDRIEEGCTEEEAVADIGTVDEISEQIIAEIPLVRITRERIKPKRQLKAWEIVLLALGSPIWLSLAVAALVVVLSLYAVLWSLIVSAWAVFVSLAACAIGGIGMGIFLGFGGNALSGIATVGVSIFCMGLAILLFFGCKTLTKAAILLTGRIALGVKKGFMKKENV